MIYPHLATLEEKDSLTILSGSGAGRGTTGPLGYYNRTYTHPSRLAGPQNTILVALEPLPVESEGAQRCEGLINGRKPCRAVGVLANRLCVDCWDSKCGTIGSGRDRGKRAAIQQLTGLQELPKRHYARRKGVNKQKAE